MAVPFNSGLDVLRGNIAVSTGYQTIANKFMGLLGSSDGNNRGVYQNVANFRSASAVSAIKIATGIAFNRSGSSAAAVNATVNIRGLCYSTNTYLDLTISFYILDNGVSPNTYTGVHLHNRGTQTVTAVKLDESTGKMDIYIEFPAAITAVHYWADVEVNWSSQTNSTILDSANWAFSINPTVPGSPLSTATVKALVGAGVALSSIQPAIASNTIDNSNWQQTWNWSTLTTGIAQSKTANTLTTGTILDITSSNNSLNSSFGLLSVANNGTSVNGMVFRVLANSNISGAGIHVRASGRVGIGNSNPVAQLTVAGAPNISNIAVSGMFASIDPSLGLTDQNTAASGTVASTAVIGVTAAQLYAANTGVVYTNASSVYIAGPPVANTNVTVTNPYALFVNTGDNYFGGSIGIGRKPVYPIDVNSTGAIRIPVGSVAQQPSSAAGLIRLNSDNPSFDYHDGTAWRTAITTAVGAVGQGAGNNQLTYFSTPGNITSNANGSFNGTNMGIGIAFVANQRVTIHGEGTTSGTYALRIHNSGGANDQFVVRNDGRVGVLTSAPVTAFHTDGFGSFGDSVTTGNAVRALNLVDAAAVMRIMRISANSATAAPALELMHRTTSDGSNTLFYDIFADSTGFNFRDRFNLSDIKVFQIGLNGMATNRTVDAANTGAITTQTYNLTTSNVSAPVNNFGARTLWAVETSTNNDISAGAMDVIWSTIAHASRTSDMVFNLVNNAGSLGEVARYSAATAPSLKIASAMGTPGTTLYQNAGITPGVAYTVGGAGQTVSITSSLASTPNAVLLEASSASSSVTVGQTIHSSTVLAKKNMVFSDQYSVASGNGFHTAISIQNTFSATGSANGDNVGIGFAPVFTNLLGGAYSAIKYTFTIAAASGTGSTNGFVYTPTINLSGSSSGIQRAIYMSPSLTLVSTGQFIGIDMLFNDAKAIGVNQTGANTINYLVGKTAFGSTTSPTDKVTVTGNHRVITGQCWSDRFALTDGATITVSWNNSNTQSVTLGGNRTFVFNDPKDGSRYTLIVKQDATGSRTAIWPATVKWAGGTAPVLTTTANRTDCFTFVWNGTGYLATASLNFNI